MTDSATLDTLVHLRAAGVSVVVDLTGGTLPRVLHWGRDLGDLDLSVARRAWRPVAHGFPVDGEVEIAVLPQESAGFLGTPGLVGSRAGQDFSTRFVVRAHAVVTDDDGTQRLTVRRGRRRRAAGAHARARAHRAGARPAAGGADQRGRRGLRARRAAAHAAGAVGGHRAARLHRPVGARAQPAADGVHARHAAAREPARADRLRLGVRARRRHRGLREPHRRGLGPAHGVVRQPPLARRAQPLPPRPARRRRAARGPARCGWPGRVVHQPVGVRVVGRRARRARGPVPRVDARAPAAPALAAAGHAQHVGGRLLPARPRPAHRAGRRRGRRRRRAVRARRRLVRRPPRRHPRRWATGTSPRTCGPTGCTRWSSTSPGSGCSSGSGWSRRWSTPTPTWPARTPTGSCASRRGCPARRGTSRCSTSPCPRPSRTSSSGSTRCSPSTPIGYLKWDHNRDLVDAGHGGAPGVHGQTLAVYRLLDELRALHPGVEIESCSSGGARVDLEILQRTDRVWASDCIDALERQQIQRWTNLLIPLELIGAHIGSGTAHSTGRRHELSFRAATALFGHLGIEWDLQEADDAAARRAGRVDRALQGGAPAAAHRRRRARGPRRPGRRGARRGRAGPRRRAVRDRDDGSVDRAPRCRASRCRGSTPTRSTTCARRRRATWSTASAGVVDARGCAAARPAALRGGPRGAAAAARADRAGAGDAGLTRRRGGRSAAPSSSSGYFVAPEVKPL